MKNNYSRLILIVFSISIIVFGIVSPLIISETVSFRFYGFAVDSANRLYIGWGNKIDVYENSKKINTINRGTSRGHYAFTIQENDTILLATGSDVIIMDLDGNNFLRHYTEANNETYEKLKTEKMIFSAYDGKLYSAKSDLLRVHIHHGDKEIFSTPIWDRFAYYLLLVNIPFFIMGICYLKKSLRK